MKLKTAYKLIPERCTLSEKASEKSKLSCIVKEGVCIVKCGLNILVKKAVSQVIEVLFEDLDPLGRKESWCLASLSITAQCTTVQ